MSEDVLLKWSEEPLKHRFSCLTDKFIKELHEVAEPMIDWLMWVFGKGMRGRNAEPSEQEMEMDMNDLEEGAPEEEVMMMMTTMTMMTTMRNNYCLVLGVCFLCKSKSQASSAKGTWDSCCVSWMKCSIPAPEPSVCPNSTSTSWRSVRVICSC